MLLQPKSFVEPDSFHCRAYGQRLAIFTCMSNFVDANALKRSELPCWKCEQGEDVRAEFAKG